MKRNKKKKKWVATLKKRSVQHVKKEKKEKKRKEKERRGIHVGELERKMFEQNEIS